MIDLALLSPDQAGNVGAILRLAACFSVRCHIVEPCGFAFSERALKRAGMDYVDAARIERHASWADFDATRRAAGRRLVLMTSRGDAALYDFSFRGNDMLLMGSESMGAPDAVHEAADARLHIPMAPAMRSLNIAIASGIALAEALRQSRQFPRQGERIDGA